MIERFKPAGHKAQELSEIVMPEETFPPIQRVIDTTLEQEDKTIGYLFRDVEYRTGLVGDIVLSRGVINDGKGPGRRFHSGWKRYERSGTSNPLHWITPSAPVILELIYRSGVDLSTIKQEICNSWVMLLKNFGQSIRTSTNVQFNDKAYITHNWTEHKSKTSIPKSGYIDVFDQNPNTVHFLHAALGKRYSSVLTSSENYIGEVRIWASTWNKNKGSVAFTVDNKSTITINTNDTGSGTIRGISLLHNFPSSHYEVLP